MGTKGPKSKPHFVFLSRYVCYSFRVGCMCYLVHYFISQNFEFRTKSEFRPKSENRPKSLLKPKSKFRLKSEQTEAELGQAQPKLRLMLKLEDFN